MSWLKSMHDSSTSVFISMAFALVYSMGFIYLMSAFAEYLAKGLVFLICGGLWFATFIAGYMYTHPLGQEAGIELTDSEKNENKKYLWASLGFGLIAILFTLLVCCTWRYIQTACDVLDATADFFADTKRIIPVQIFFFVFTLILVIIWIFGIMGLWSIAVVTAKSDSSFP